MDSLDPVDLMDNMDWVDLMEGMVDGLHPKLQDQVDE